jgi:hypothetical protein
MENINFIEAVTERDIDLLLLEELTVSEDFFAWVINKTVKQKNAKPYKVWHSLMDAEFGESDLVLVYKDGKEKKALLLENKIDAIAQPEQAERYMKRGEKGVADGLWKEFATCLVAPETYLDSIANASLYQHQLSYEAVRRWYLKQVGLRAKYKAQFVLEAIEKSRRGYTIVPDDRVSAFWYRYFELATKHFPELQLSRPSKKPAQSCWIAFKPKSLPKGTRIVHKLDRGYVDFEIRGAAKDADQLIGKFQEIIPKDVSIEITGKSLSLRREVPIVNHFGNADDQAEEIKEGLQAASAILAASSVMEACFI